MIIGPSAPDATSDPTKTVRPGSLRSRIGARLGVGVLIFCALKGAVYLALAAGGIATLWP